MSSVGGGIYGSIGYSSFEERSSDINAVNKDLSSSDASRTYGNFSDSPLLGLDVIERANNLKRNILSFREHGKPEDITLRDRAVEIYKSKLDHRIRPIGFEDLIRECETNVKKFEINSNNLLVICETFTNTIGSQKLACDVLDIIIQDIGRQRGHEICLDSSNYSFYHALMTRLSIISEDPTLDDKWTLVINAIDKFIENKQLALAKPPSSSPAAAAAITSSSSSAAVAATAATTAAAATISSSSPAPSVNPTEPTKSNVINSIISQINETQREIEEQEKKLADLKTKKASLESDLKRNLENPSIGSNASTGARRAPRETWRDFFGK
jgi:hypothetical protein